MTHRLARLLLALAIGLSATASVLPGIGDDPHGAFAADQRTYTGGRF